MTDEDLRRTTYYGDSPTTSRPRPAPATPSPHDTDPLKVAVIYYSATGSVHALAQSVAQGARDAGGSVRVVRVRETAPPEAIEANAQWRAHLRDTHAVPIASLGDVEAADVLILGSPTRFGHVSSQLQAFIDTWGPLWGENAFADKVFAAFTSSATRHGGQETTLMSIYTTVCHLGGIIVPPGYTDPAQFATGNPYGASSTSDNGQRPPTEEDLRGAWVTGHRAVRVARELALGRRVLST